MQDARTTPANNWVGTINSKTIPREEYPAGFLDLTLENSLILFRAA